MDFEKAVEILRGGGVIAVPTETVYGLACDAENADAVAKIYAMKGRPPEKPLSLLVADTDALDIYCKDIPEAAWMLAEQFWPGPLTVALPSKGREAAIVRAGGETIGLRCPDHPLTRELLRRFGGAVAAPSANPSGAVPPVTASQVEAYFGGQIDGILDGGVCEKGESSTVLDLSRTPYRILRQGALAETEIFTALRENLTLIGITGGSGCGKTTALRTLSDMGALILDADQIYHELTETSEAMRLELTARFGAAYEGGRLNRKALGNIVFQDAGALADLNRITHKYVLAEIDRRLLDFALRGGEIAAIDAIALLESGLGDGTVWNVAITAPLEARIQRLVIRDGIPENAARMRIAAQKNNEYFMERCKYTLENNTGETEFAALCQIFFEEGLNYVRRKKTERRAEGTEGKTVLSAEERL